jgi:glycosyltransferase involved in cell wall biosynthesis
VTYQSLTDLTDRDLLIAYQESDIVTFCSVYEGFGMPIIEANAIGRPVLTSNISPLIEVAGDAACFVNPDDANSIRDGLERIINNETWREELIRRGLANAQRFRADTIARMHASVYKTILHSPPSGSGAAVDSGFEALPRPTRHPAE